MAVGMIALAIFLVLGEITSLALWLYFIWWVSVRVRDAARARKVRALAGWSLAWLALTALLVAGVCASVTTWLAAVR